MPKKIKKINNQVIVYQAKSGAIELKADKITDTIWANQSNIADIFNIERSVATKHIRNILKDKELDVNSVCAKIAHTASDGKTYQVQVYNLDVILAVGYRTNSQKAIEFRKWATKILREHITNGYTINPRVIKYNYNEFQKAIAEIKYLFSEGEQSMIDHGSVIELINLFADTWLSLDAYDKDLLLSRGATKKRVSLTAEKLTVSLTELKLQLIKKGEASDLFGRERSAGSIAGIIGNVMQSFGGREVYPTVEEKAAHLLYFMVKDHPFIDGNKRSGAYSFVWFLRQAKILDYSKITPPALTALTILVAESNPKDKDKMIKLILTILGNKK